MYSTQYRSLYFKVVSLHFYGTTTCIPDAFMMHRCGDGFSITFSILAHDSFIVGDGEYSYAAAAISWMSPYKQTMRSHFMGGKTIITHKPDGGGEVI